MGNKIYANLALEVMRSWGTDYPNGAILHVADKLVYHQRRLPGMNEEQIEKVLGKCRELTGTPWEEDNGSLVGQFKVPR